MPERMEEAFSSSHSFPPAQFCRLSSVDLHPERWLLALDHYGPLDFSWRSQGHFWPGCLFVVRPQANDLDRLLLVQDLVDESVLNVDAPGAGAGEIADELLE